MKTLATLLAALLIITTVQPAMAKTTRKQKLQAKKAFKRADMDYKLGDFKKALEGYSRAYKLFPAAGFLFNIGQCHRKLGNHERAVFFFKGYLREKPRARNRGLVEELIAESEKILAASATAARKKAEQARLEKQKQDAEKRRLEDEKNKREQARLAHERRLAMEKAKADAAAAAAKAAEEDRRREEARARSGEAKSTPVYKTWWLWTIVGVVVAGGAATAAVLLTQEPPPVLPSGSLGTLDGRTF